MRLSLRSVPHLHSLCASPALVCVCVYLFVHADAFFWAYRFGSIQERLATQPRYCNHILQISCLRETQPELVKHNEGALMRGERNQHEIAANGIFLADRQFNSTVQSGTHSSLMPLEGLEQLRAPPTSIELEEKKSFNL